MLKIKGKLFDSDAVISFDDSYLCNGHWLLARSFLELAEQKKTPFFKSSRADVKRLLNIYRAPHEVDFKTNERSLNEFVIGALSWQKNKNHCFELRVTNQFKPSPDHSAIQSMILESEQFKTGIDPVYFPIFLASEKALQRNDRAPIYCLDADENMIAMIMPMRI